MSLKIIPVIMSGGSGTRLWPLSTPQAPKQFHALGTDHTMIQETALRLSGEAFLQPVVICGASHETLARTQLEISGHKPQAIILEPMARNTAAVAATAAIAGLALDPNALLLMVPADHVISKSDVFRATVMAAAETARSRIVTFGIRPTSPETGYGYIHRGEALSDGIYDISRFLEKPNLATAESYVADGGYDWNAGIFLFSPQVMIEELKLYAPDVLRASEEAFALAKLEGNTYHLDASAFGRSPSISVDYAVMEKTKRAAVAPCDIGWADVGGFSELWRLGAKDEQGNHVHGKAVFVDAGNNLVRAEGAPVAVIGLDNIMVIATPAGILVAPLLRSQDVKLASEAIKTLE
jgi:mannose-1-phosphate guanylyltransferase / mannose-6-phosphate isomerase